MNYQISQIERIHRALHPEPRVFMQPPFDLGYSQPDWKPTPAAENTADVEPLPPTIQASPRDFAEEIAEACAPISSYLDAFEVVERSDNFEEGYVNPVSTKQPQPPEKSAEVLNLETRKNSLVQELVAWKDALCQFLEDHRAWTTAQLQAEHAAAWTAAREQKTLVASLVTRANEGAEELRKAKAMLSKARLDVNAHAAARPSLASLPTQTEIDSWEHNDTELRTNLQVAQDKLDKMMDSQRLQLREYEREKIALARSLQHEADLRRRLQGSGVDDGIASEI